MSDSIDRLVDQISSYMDSTKDFVLEQAPDIVNQIATYGFWSSAMYCSIGAACLIASYFLAKQTSSLIKEDEYSELAAPVGIACIIFLTMGLAFIITNADSAIKAKCAPKLYVIEWCLQKGRK